MSKVYCPNCGVQNSFLVGYTDGDATYTCDECRTVFSCKNTLCPKCSDRGWFLSMHHGQVNGAQRCECGALPHSHWTSAAAIKDLVLMIRNIHNWAIGMGDFEAKAIQDIHEFVIQIEDCQTE